MTTPRCRYCLGPLGPRHVEIDAPFHGRVQICEGCWNGEDPKLLAEALGIELKEKNQ